MLTSADLVVGNPCFTVEYYDDDRHIVKIDTLIYVGEKRSLDGMNAAHQWCFQTAESCFEQGVFLGVPPEEERVPPLVFHQPLERIHSLNGLIEQLNVLSKKLGSEQNGDEIGLIVGGPCFMLSYFDNNMQIPEIETYILIGRNLFPNEGPGEWYFQTASSYLSSGPFTELPKGAEWMGVTFVRESDLHLVSSISRLIDQLNEVAKRLD